MPTPSSAAFTSSGKPADVGIIPVEPVGAGPFNAAETIVMRSKVTELIAAWREEDGFDPKKGGHPATVSEEVILVLMAVLAIEGKPLHIQQAATIVLERADNRALRRLGMPARNEEDYDDPKFRHNMYMRLYRAWRRVHDMMNPFDDVRLNKRVEESVWDSVVEMRNSERIALRMQWLNQYNNRLSFASSLLMPEGYKDTWTGDVAVDGTPIPAARIGTSKRGARVSSEPDAGWYRREGDHKGSKTDKTMWVYEETLVTHPFPEHPEGDPSLVVGMSLDKPGHRIAENALAAMEHLIDSPAIPKDYFMSDRAYQPNAKTEKLAQPLREAGYCMVSDQSKASRGLMGTYKGAELIDGSWYFPGMPDKWKHASADYYDNKAITPAAAGRVCRQAPSLRFFWGGEKTRRADAQSSSALPCVTVMPR